MTSNFITHALISVSDKEEIIEFAKALVKLDIKIISTGGTAALLRKHNLTVLDVSEFTGFPEVMDGRVRDASP